MTASSFFAFCTPSGSPSIRIKELLSPSEGTRMLTWQPQNSDRRWFDLNVILTKARKPPPIFVGIPDDDESLPCTDLEACWWSGRFCRWCCDETSGQCAARRSPFGFSANNVGYYWTNARSLICWQVSYFSGVRLVFYRTDSKPWMMVPA